MNNRDLEDYNNWVNNQNSSFAQFKKNINAVQLIALAGAIYLAWYMLKSNTNNSKWYLLGLGAIILIILFKPTQKAELEPIPENTIKIIAKILLDRKIGDETGQIPAGSTVTLMLQSAIRWQGEWGQAFTPWEWGVGFYVKYPDGLVKDYIAIFNPYKGYITAIKDLPYGWDNKWVNDLKVLMPTMFKQEGQAGSSGLTVTKA